MEISEQIGEYITSIKFDDIPAKVKAEKKKNILDILGVMVAGANASGCKTIVDEIIEWGGREDASIICYERKVPVHNAAIANCMMARALDYDDVFAEAIIHINATSVPVAFVVSEYIGGASGKELLTAITVAADLAARMGVANYIPSNISGFSFSFQFGSIIAAIVAGKLMGLSRKEMQNALGIAYSQLAGNNQGYVDGAMTIRLQQGFSAGAGVLAAVLAKKGITGAKDILDGRFGYYNVFAGGQYNKDILKRELGSSFYGVKHTIKPYPCCTHLHGAIDGILEILAENPIAANDVREVNIRVNQAAYNICCIPIKRKRRPKSVVDLQFSFNYVVAAAIIDGKIGLDSFKESALQRNDILDFGENKIFTYIDEQMDKRNDKSITKTKIELILNDGSALRRSIPFAKGSKEKPMSIEECVEKFRMCLKKAKRPITDENISEAITLIKNFEKMEDVKELYYLLW